MEQFIRPIIERVTDPYFLVLVAIIFGLMKLVGTLLGSIEKRDEAIADFRKGMDGVKDQLAENREVQSSILKLIEVLIYDKSGVRHG